MKKLIAKTIDGKEYMHSKEQAFFANTNAQKIADALNRNKYQIKDGEHWHVYDHDYTQDFYVCNRLYIARNGSIKAVAISN